MKTYSPIPSLSGVITDDYLFFEGTARPAILFALFDGINEKISKEKIIELEAYWNDMYNLFLRKLTSFAGSTPLHDEDKVKLQALLQELIKVKDLIENVPQPDIMER